MNTIHDLLDSMASDCKLADHAYQLALGSGDQQKIKQALRFWNDCDADYQDALRKFFKSAKARQQRRQVAIDSAGH